MVNLLCHCTDIFTLVTTRSLKLIPAAVTSIWGSRLGALGVNQTIQRIAVVAVRGAILGGVFGATDAILQGKSGADIFSEALQGGLIGAAFGPLLEIKFIAPVIIALGTASGIKGTLDAIDQKNYALAAFRGIATYAGFRTFIEEPTPTAPQPLSSGGRLGSASTRAQLEEIAQTLQEDGWTITGGGGQAPEEICRLQAGGERVEITLT